MPNHTPKTVLITGSTDGLGLGTAHRVAAGGHDVIVHGRSQGRIDAACSEIESATGRRPGAVIGDFASLATVKGVADQVSEITDSLDVLVCNAGIGTGYPEGRERSESADGIELRWAVNFLAPVLLTRSLLPMLTTTPSARVVLVASDGQARVDLDNVMLTHDYSGEQAYCQSKLALVAFGLQLAARQSTVSVTSMHPGSFMATKIVVDDGAAVVDDLDGGIDALFRLAMSPEFDGMTGTYFERTRPARALEDAYDSSVQQRLWDLSEEQMARVGVALPLEPLH